MTKNESSANQMPLFGIPPVTGEPDSKKEKPAPKKKITDKKTPGSEAKTAPRKAPKTALQEKPAKAAKSLSGLVPDGDVRLTANIREDLHLRLKIAAAKRRTTIGELIEEMVEQYID